MEMCPPDVTLKITTNGTVTPKFNGKTILDYIPKFKEVQMNISIEFWGGKITIYVSLQGGNVLYVQKFKTFENCVMRLSLHTERT